MHASRPSWMQGTGRGLVAMAGLLLAGCGFHLQGRASLPPVLAAVHVEPFDAQSDFYLGLRSALRSSGSRLLEAGSGEAAEIRILADGTGERVVTVSGRNIPTAYQLDYTVKLSVRLGERELIAPEEHTLSREYSFNETALLAKERERETLSEALADDLVTLVMRRLASLSGSP